MELIVIRIECIDVLSDGTGKLVLNILAHLGVSLVSPIAVGLVVHDLLLDRGDVRLLGNLHSTAAHDGENRRGTGLLLIGVIVLGSNRCGVGHEQVIPLVRGGKGGTGIKSLTGRGHGFFDSQGNLIEKIILLHDRGSSGIRNRLGKVVGNLLRGRGIGDTRPALALKDPQDGSLRLIARPADIGHDLLSVLVQDIGLKDLIRLELGGSVVRVLRDGDGVVALSRKRHRDRGHNSAEAQGCCEAGGYCQACDVLVHAHLLFLRFPVGSHSIGHHLSVS